jgi:succinoglycan biosynthesis protein ExoA
MKSDSLLATRRSGGPSVREAGSLFVSVIMPVRNEARFIERTLAQLVNQEYDHERFEILVVDGESTDGTPTIVEKFAAAHANVRLLMNPKKLSSAARNIAVRQARGDVVLLVDGHCDLPGKHCLRDLADAFERSGADCMGRPQPQELAAPFLSHQENKTLTSVQRAIAAARLSRLGHHPDSYIYSSTEGFVPAKSVAVAYRRAVFEKIGGFDERFDACEDVEFNHRVDGAGMRCFFTPRIAAHYAPRDTLRGLFRQLFRYGRGRVRLWRKHPETLSIKTLLPGLFVLGCVVGFGLAWTSAWLAAAYAAALASYLTLVLIGSIVAAIKPSSRPHQLSKVDWAALMWLPPVFVTIHVGAGAGLLWEAVFGLRRRDFASLAAIEHGSGTLQQSTS